MKNRIGIIDTKECKNYNNLKNVMKYYTSLHFFRQKYLKNSLCLRYITMQKWFCQHFGRLQSVFLVAFL